MKQTFVLFILLAGCNQVNGQVESKNAVFTELGGNAYYYSINYERSFSNGILIRGGIGAANEIFTVPILGGKHFGKGDHRLEMTAGIMFMSGNSNGSQELGDGDITQKLFATAFIGYRYQKPEKKFLFRVGYTPLYKIYDAYPPFNNHTFYHWGGLAFGYRF